MRLKIKASTIIFILVLLCIAMESKWYNIFGISGLVRPRYVLAVLLFLYCRVARGRQIKKYCVFIDRFYVLMLCLTLVELVFTLLNNDIDLMTAVSNACVQCVKMLMVYPFIYLMDRGYENKIETGIIFFCGVSLVYQIVAATIYNTSGVVVNEYFWQSDVSLRNDMTRFQTTCLAWVLLAILFAKLLDAKKFRDKVLFAIGSAIALVYIIFVNQSRALDIAVVFMLAMMFLLKKRRNNKQIFIVLLFLVAIIIFLQSSMFSNFMESFFGGENSTSILIRLEKMQMIFSEFIKHPLTGFGFIGGIYYFSASTTFYFIDYGIVGELLQYGFWTVVFYVCLITRLFSNIKLKKNVKDRFYILDVGFTACLIAGFFGFTLLNDNRIFAIPLILAITEYSRQVTIRRQVDVLDNTREAVE